MDKILKSVMVTGILSLFLILSCSDDDSTPTNEGNLDDPAFLFADNMFGTGFNNLNFLAIEKMSYMVDSVVANEVPKLRSFIPAKANFNINYISTDYTLDGKWYVFDDSIHVFATSSDEPDSIKYSATDSISFAGGDSLMAPPDINSIDSVLLHFSATFTAYDDGTVLVFTYSNALAISADQFGSDTITVNGTTSFSGSGPFAFSDQDICDMTVSYTVSYDDLQIGWLDAMIPYDGDASATASISLDCDAGASVPDITGNWTASWSLGGGNVTSTYVHGEDRWVYTESLD